MQSAECIVHSCGIAFGDEFEIVRKVDTITVNCALLTVHCQSLLLWLAAVAAVMPRAGFFSGGIGGRRGIATVALLLCRSGSGSLCGLLASTAVAAVAIFLRGSLRLFRLFLLGRSLFCHRDGRFFYLATDTDRL